MGTMRQLSESTLGPLLAVLPVLVLSWGLLAPVEANSDGVESGVAAAAESQASDESDSTNPAPAVTDEPKGSEAGAAQPKPQAQGSPGRLKNGVWDARRGRGQKRRGPQEPIKPRPEVAEEYERVLLVLTTAEDPDERSRASMKLALLAPKAAVAPLVEALEDPEPTVVINVMYALQATGRSAAIAPILRMQAHPDPRVRATVPKIVTPGAPTMSVR